MATPTDHDSRGAMVFFRGPVGANTFCYGTKDQLRNGLVHLGRLTEFPQLVDNPLDEFGIQQGASTQIAIADEGDDDWLVLDEDGSPILDEDEQFLISEY